MRRIASTTFMAAVRPQTAVAAVMAIAAATRRGAVTSDPAAAFGATVVPVPQTPKTRPSNSFKPCRDGAACWNFACPFRHPPHRKACPEGATCRYRSACGRGLHPPKCPQRDRCRDATCALWHPQCSDGVACWRVACRGHHPPGHKRCPAGKDCPDPKACDKGTHPPPCGYQRGLPPNACPIRERCNLWHPPGDVADCKAGVTCWHRDCSLRHPADRRVCPDGKDCAALYDECGNGLHPPACGNGERCFHLTCPKSHPPGHRLCPLGNKCVHWDSCTRGAHPPPCDFGARCRVRGCPFRHPFPGEW